jgi:hypothetical protein
MKTKLFLTIVLTFAGWSAKAQCNPAIPSTSIVISSTDTVTTGADPLWVCSGGSLKIDGTLRDVYLESGAIMETGGGIHNIYVPSGAKLNIFGGIHNVYYVDILDITNAGGLPTYIPCTSITYNYSNAPASGCIITSLSSETEKVSNISVYPNPSSGIFKITSSIEKGTFEIYNVQSKKVYSGSVSSNFQIDISEQPNGIYFLQLSTSEGMVNKKIILTRPFAK